MEFPQDSDDGGIILPGTESVSPTRPVAVEDRWQEREFGVNLENEAWELDSEFSPKPNLLLGMYKAQAPKGKIILLVIDALSARAKSTPTMKGVAKHASGLAQYYLDTREEPKVQLAGEDSLVLIRDYLESLTERGRTVPSSAKHAIAVWAEALGIDWPPTHSLACSADTVDSDESPKQAP